MIRRIFYILVILGAVPAVTLNASSLSDVSSPIDSLESIEKDIDADKVFLLKESAISRREILGSAGSPLNPPKGDFELPAENNFTALWEESAFRKIWNRSFAEDLSGSGENVFYVNSYTSVEIIDSINDRKAFLKKVLKAGLKDARLTLYDKQILKQFNKYANACISPLSKDEKYLIEESAAKIVKNDCLPGNDLKKDSNHDRNIVIFATLISVINSDSGNTKNIKKILKKNTLFKDICRINRNVNLNRYSLRKDKADIFSLFLYIWEDNEGKTHKNKIFFVPSFITGSAFCTAGVLNVLNALPSANFASVRPLNPPEGDFETPERNNRNNFNILKRSCFSAGSSLYVNAATNAGSSLLISPGGSNHERSLVCRRYVKAEDAGSPLNSPEWDLGWMV